MHLVAIGAEDREILHGVVTPVAVQVANFENFRHSKLATVKVTLQVLSVGRCDPQQFTYLKGEDSPCLKRCRTPVFR